MKLPPILGAPALAAAIGTTLAMSGPVAPAWAQARAGGQPVPAVAGAVDPAAMTALNRMTAYMRTLKTFEIQTDTSIEEVVDDGVKLTFEGQNTYKVKRPNAFFIETKSDRKIRDFIYDGRSFTVFSPRMNYFATVSAPGTIDEVLADASDRFGIELPLADLFYWGTEGTPTNLIRAASVIGYAKIGGVDTDQYLFRGQHLDFQVWIARGDQPLPRKMVITTVDDPAKPSYTATLSWNTSPTFAADTFTFKPPTDAKPIRMATSDGK